MIFDYDNFTNNVRVQEFGVRFFLFSLPKISTIEMQMLTPGFSQRCFHQLKHAKNCFKARSHDPVSRIQFLLVPKIGSCEHSRNDLRTHESVILKKNPDALFSSDTLHESWKAPTKTEPWRRTVWAPLSNFLSRESDPWNRIVWTGL